MVRIGITGHRGLGTATSDLVSKALRRLLTPYNPTDLIGVTCIADGADALFAEAVLEHGGAIEVIIPASQYRDHLPAEHHPRYDDLLSRAKAVHNLRFHESTSESHMEASELMISMIDELVAVWDGLPARGYGGTADVVQEALKQGIPVQTVWPDGARRDG